MSPKNTRLAGHELFSEGAPFNAKGHAIMLDLRYSTRGEGHGKCSCGALSPSLDSANKRKQWHRDHKQEIRSEAPHV